MLLAFFLFRRRSVVTRVWSICFWGFWEMLIFTQLSIRFYITSFRRIFIIPNDLPFVIFPKKFKKFYGFCRKWTFFQKNLDFEQCMELYNHKSILELKLDHLRIEWHPGEVGPSRPLKLTAIFMTGILVENLKNSVFI